MRRHSPESTNKARSEPLDKVSGRVSEVHSAFSTEAFQRE